MFKNLEKKINLSLVVLLVSSCVLVVLWFPSDGVRGGAESGLPFFDLKRVATITNHAWADTGLGLEVGIGVAGHPTFSFLSTIVSLGVRSTVVQASVYFLILFVSGLSVYYLTKTFFSKIENKFALLAIYFYWFNPISLVNAMGRNLDNFKFFFVAFPLLWLVYILGLKHKKYYFLVFFALITGVFSYSFTTMPSILLLWFTLFLTSAFYIIPLQRKNVFFGVTYFMGSFVGFLLVNFWWVVQVLGFIFSPSFTTSKDGFFTSQGNLAVLSSISKRLGLFVNNLRLMHGPYYYESPEWNWPRIYTLPFFVILEFFPVIVILYSIYKFRRVKEVLFLGLFFTLALFLIKGNEDPLGEIFQFGFQRLVFLQVLRNPFEKIGFLLSLVSAPLFAFGVWKISSPKSWMKRFVFPFSFLLIVVFYGYPFWTGLVFTNTESGTLRSNSINVPEYYKKASEWFDSQEGVFRFVSLPIGGEAITYTWENNYLGVELSNLLFNTPNVSFNTTIPFYSKLAGELIKYQSDEEVLGFFPFINARYIVWRSDIENKARKMPDPMLIRRKLDEWVKEGYLTKRAEFDKLAVFEIEDKYFWPKIYSTKNIYISNSVDIPQISGYMSNFPTKRAVVMDEECIRKCTDFNELVYVPQKVYLQKVTSPLPKELSDEELLGKLFYSKHLPGGVIYPFIRLNEKFLEAREKDYDGWLLYKVGIVGKRAAEIYKLKKSYADNQLIKNAEKDYMEEIRALEADIVTLSKRESSVSEVVRNSLIYQWVLLERAEVDLKENPLPELLSKWNVKPTFELPAAESSYMIANLVSPTDGQYTIEGIDKIEGAFLDSKSLSSTGLEKIYLNEGEHEVAILLDDSDFYETVLDKADELLFVDNLSNTGWKFDVSSLPSVYQLEFEYRFVRGSLFQVDILQNVEKEKSGYVKYVKKDDNYHGWSKFNEKMETFSGSTEIELAFGPTKENFCEKLWWGWKRCGTRDSEFSVEIRNLKFLKINTPKLLLTLKGDKVLDTDSQVLFEKLSPTQYLVNVDKHDESQEVLVFSELFNSNWNATYSDGVKIADENHLIVNGYANGWLINRAGKSKILLDFKPEQYLQSGRRISFYVLIGGIASIAILIIKKRRGNA